MAIAEIAQLVQPEPTALCEPFSINLKN